MNQNHNSVDFFGNVSNNETEMVVFQTDIGGIFVAAQYSENYGNKPRVDGCQISRSHISRSRAVTNYFWLRACPNSIFKIPGFARLNVT